MQMGLKSHNLICCLLAIFTSSKDVASQSNASASCEGDNRLNLAFLVDSSDSVCASSSDKFYVENCSTKDDYGACMDKLVNCSNWQRVLNFTAHVVEPLAIGPELTQVAVALFGDKPILQGNFNEYNTSSSLIQAIQYNVPYLKFSETKLDVGLKLTLDKIFNPVSVSNRSGVPNLLIVVTNGRTTTGSRRAKNVATQLQKLNVHIVTVGITPDVNKEELCEIATPSNSSDPNATNCFYSDDFGDLDRILSGVMSLTCRLSATKSTSTSAAMAASPIAEPTTTANTAALFTESPSSGGTLRSSPSFHSSRSPSVSPSASTAAGVASRKQRTRSPSCLYRIGNLQKRIRTRRCTKQAIVINDAEGN